MVESAAAAVMELLRRLLDQHRVARRRDPLAAVEQYLVQCPACDGNRWQIQRPDVPVEECQFIQDARALGIEI